MTVKLNLCVKELKPEVNYINPYKVINTNPTAMEIKEKGDFLNQILQKGVRELPSKKKKVMIKVCKTLITLSVSFLMIGNTAFAQSPGAESITHQDIVQIGLYLIGILAIASTVLASLLAMLSGNLRMLKKKKEATEWLTDILKGYFIVLVAPVVVLTMALLAYLLFGSFDWFIKPF